MLAFVIGGALSAASCNSPPTAPADSAAANPPAPPAEDKSSFRVFSSRRSYCLVISPPPAKFPLNQMFQINVTVLDGATMTPLRDADLKLTFDADMPEHRHGMKTQPKSARNPDGSFTIRGILLHMAGDWELYLDVTRGGLTERAQVSVTLE